VGAGILGSQLSAAGSSALVAETRHGRGRHRPHVDGTVIARDPPRQERKRGLAPFTFGQGQAAFGGRGVARVVCPLWGERATGNGGGHGAWRFPEAYIALTRPPPCGPVSQMHNQVAIDALAAADIVVLPLAGSEGKVKGILDLLAAAPGKRTVIGISSVGAYTRPLLSST
jgi:hypothetical protein